MAVWTRFTYIKSLLESGIEKEYCLLITDIYQESHFQVICGKELSKEFLLTKGTKTGCPLSSILFIIDLDQTLKEIYSHAIISSNIQNEKRVSPLPVGGFADDIVFISYLDQLLKEMKMQLIEKMGDSGLKIRPDKCAIFYDCNRWYKAKGDTPPKIKIGRELVKILKRNDPFTYLGKLLTVAGETVKEISDILDTYTELLQQILACPLSLALKI